MGKLKTFGIGVSIFFGIIILLGVISVATLSSDVIEESTTILPQEQSKSTSTQFDFLSTNQKLSLENLKSGCKNQIENAHAISDFAGELLEKECQKRIQNKLDGFQNEFITKQAIKNQDFTICNSSNLKENCLISFSHEFQKPSVCNELDDNNNCFTSYAKKFEQPDICLQSNHSQSCLEEIVLIIGASACILMEDHKQDNCKKDYFISEVDTYQTQIRYNETYQNCIKNNSFIVIQGSCFLNILNLEDISVQDLLAWQNTEETITCSSHIKNLDDEKKMDYCTAIIGAYAKDLSLCDKAGQAKAACYGAIAWNDDLVNLSTCERLNERGEILSCYMNVAGRLQDRSICDTDFDSGTNFENNCNRIVDKRLAWENK